MAKEFAKAEGKRVQITNEQTKQIKQMYRDIEKDFKERIRILSNRSNVSSVMRTQYLKDFSNDLEKSIETLNARLENQIVNNMLEVSQAVVDDNEKMIRNMGIDGVFTKDYYIPQNCVERIVSGQIYEGKWTLSKAIWSDNQKKLNDINSIIARGMAENKSTFEIAKDLERYVNPQARKGWDWSKVYPGTSKKIDYNAQRLARTMVSHAYQEAFVETTKDNPFIESYRWLASGGDRMCDLCAERDGKIFSKDELPLDHPNGMCTFEVVIEKSYDQIASDLKNWVNNEGDPKLNDKLDSYAETLGYNVKEWTSNSEPVKNANADNLTVISKNSGDEITIQMALESWAQNATGIRAASNGDVYGRLFGPVGLNDEAKAEVIEKWISQGDGVKQKIFRGLSNLSQEDFVKMTTIGKEIDQQGLSSWTTDKAVATGFGHIGNSIVLIQDGTSMGRKISDTYNATDIEKEVIVSAKARQEILKIEKEKYYTKVFVKEIK